MIKAYRAWRLRRDQRHDIIVLACIVLGLNSYMPIWRRTGLGSGAVYPALFRLERHGLIIRRSQHELDEEGRWLGYQPTDLALGIFAGEAATRRLPHQPRGERATSPRRSSRLRPQLTLSLLPSPGGQNEPGSRASIQRG